MMIKKITTMKTKKIFLSFVAILAFISLNVSANYAEDNKDKKIIAPIAVSNDLTDNETNFESWMIELNEFNNFAGLFPDEEIQIESWMTVEFSSASENSYFMDQEIILEDWMINSADFNNEERSFDVELEIEPWMCEIM